MNNRELCPFERALFDVIEKGDLNKSIQCVKSIEETQDERLDAFNEEGNNFLLYALHAKQMNIASMLFDLFLEKEMFTAIWKENNLNQTIFHLAAKQKISTSLLEAFYRSCPLDEKHTSIEEVIFDKVNQLDKLGNTPLHYACHHGAENTIYFLLEKGARTDIRNNEGKFAINLAVEYGNCEIFNALLVQMNDVDFSVITDIDGNTLLHTACTHGHVDMVTLLLKQGINLHLLNISAQTALDLAMSSEIKAVPDKRSDYKKIITLLDDALNHSQMLPKNLLQTLTIFNKKRKINKQNNNPLLREMLLQLEIQTNALLRELQNESQQFLCQKKNTCTFTLLINLVIIMVSSILFLATTISLAFYDPQKSNKDTLDTYSKIAVIAGCIDLFSLVIVLGLTIPNCVINLRISHRHQEELSILIGGLKQIKHSLPEVSPFHRRFTNLINELTKSNRVLTKIELLQNSLKPLLSDMVVSCNPTPDIKLYPVPLDESSLQYREENSDDIDLVQLMYDETGEVPLVKYK